MELIAWPYKLIIISPYKRFPERKPNRSGPCGQVWRCFEWNAFIDQEPWWDQRSIVHIAAGSLPVRVAIGVIRVIPGSELGKWSNNAYNALSVYSWDTKDQKSYVKFIRCLVFEMYIGESISEVNKLSKSLFYTGGQIFKMLRLWWKWSQFMDTPPPHTHSFQTNMTPMIFTNAQRRLSILSSYFFLIDWLWAISTWLSLHITWM